MRLNLTTKILVLMAAITLLALAASLWIFSHFENQRLHSRVRQDAGIIASLVQELYLSSGRADKTILQPLVDGIAKLEVVRYVEIYDKSAMVIAHSVHTHIGNKPLQAHSVSVAKVLATGAAVDVVDDATQQHIHLAALHSRDMSGAIGINGVVEIVMNRQWEEQSATALNNRIVSGAFAVAGVSFTLLLLILKRFVLCPLRTLTLATSRLGEGHFEQRVELSTHDEMGQLASSFNCMAENLRHSHDDLEAKIRKRTSDLETTVGQLQREVNERLLAEEALHAAKDQAEEANRAKSMFLSRMSHELRTPLNAIIGFAQIMEMSADNETMGAHRHNLNTVIRSGWHLLRIIEDLLNLSAIEAKKVTLNIENIAVRECVYECFDLLSPLARERRIEFRCVDDEFDRMIVRADSFRLKQVLINLLANAVKFNREGGSVAVSGLCTPGRLRILISDTGPGIPEDGLSSLFQPFSRLTERPYNIEGAGIGLSIAKHLTELMGGMIGVESEHGKGSTFWIELPAAEASETVHASTEADPPRNDKSVKADNQAILLYIEDNPVHVSLISAIIARMDNLSLLAAPTPSLGLELARARRPDLILLDICLPGMNGFEVLDCLLADERTRDIPVIAISASANPAEIEKGLRAGFRRYLTKPLNVAKFKDAVEELLRDTVR